MTWFETHGLFSDHKCGFRSNCSTELEVIAVQAAHVTAWVPCAISQKLLRFLGYMYVSPNLPRFRGPGIEALKLYPRVLIDSDKIFIAGNE